ncbi:hypothetical protein O0I10_005753 [Lichtheimia ornata]|uniref:Uncharacterized protein n=1 Tax=Lichtheimia ornata TaxID=688661 RepID=A0AAD7XZA8_9FUNG|nr:uncharacterized protein O0I10_005753 [Lichtheimia ornata]KAJ8658401.1 hypothetical protein O0I10_005753 [Lichtheimia ornata]
MEQPTSDLSLTTREAAFSIMLASIGLCCFTWQSSRAGWMFYKVRKPIHAIVFAQAFLGIILNFVTLLASLTRVDCMFILIFSVVGVNVGDIALQSVLLWKAYLGNNRSKIILVLGAIPIVGLAVFICANITIARSTSMMSQGVCNTNYRK